MVPRGQLDDLVAFATVARHRSFKRAATELEVSTSNLSHIINRLEGRLNVRLLQRNSRSVSPTEAGAELLHTLAPALELIAGAIDSLHNSQDVVSGALRITATRQAYEMVVRPVLPTFMKLHPRAIVEVQIDTGFRDIIADQFDAGIRLGEKLEQDMVAISVSPQLRMAVVASPTYWARYGIPQTPRELSSHHCINYRLQASAGIYAWEFEHMGKAFDIRVPGPLVFNEPQLMLDCALSGQGVAYILEHDAAPHIERGALIQILKDWTPPFAGYFLYYPSRRQPRPVLAALLALVKQNREAP